MPTRVAIFLDHENLYISWQHKTGSRKFDPAAIEAIAAQYGTVIVRRAYDNWSRDRTNARNRLVAAGYHCEDVPTHRIEKPGRRSSGWRRKNMADIAIATDLVLAAARDYADVFLIGSGDGSFAYLARKLVNPLGKQPVFLSVAESTSNLIYETGYDVHLYGDWVGRELDLPAPAPDPEDTYAGELAALLGLIERLREQGLPSPRSLLVLLSGEVPTQSLAALIERARIRGDLICEETGEELHVYLPGEVLEDRRPPLRGLLETRLAVLHLLGSQPPRTLKDWHALLREQRGRIPGSPSNRVLQAMLAELKNRGMLVEGRVGRRDARLDLRTRPLLRWLGGG